MNKSYLKKNVILMIMSNSLIYLPSPININLWWNLGSMLGLCLIIQTLSGLFLSMHYVCDVNLSFFSIIHIIQDVNYGWFMRLMHMNGASFFFMCVYIHIGRGLYYGSFKLSEVWVVGVLILLMMMGTAFLGYVLPWGQMSFWGATVITNLMSAVPYLGSMLVTWLWGGFSVDNPTLNRFYTFHFLVPFILMGMVMIHLMFLHDKGSNNPMGLKSDNYKIMFYMYYLYKDLMSFLYFFIFYFYIVLESPYLLGDPENFIMANSMITPVHIQPEWYFLFAYTILRSIPDKLSGVLALLMSILILLIFPFMYKNNFQSLLIYPINQIYYMIFLGVVMLLTWLGAQPVEYPFTELSQILTILYFGYFFMNYYIMNFWDNYMN